MHPRPSPPPLLKSIVVRDSEPIDAHPLHLKVHIEDIGEDHSFPVLRQRCWPKGTFSGFVLMITNHVKLFGINQVQVF